MRRARCSWLARFLGSQLGMSLWLAWFLGSHFGMSINTTIVDSDKNKALEHRPWCLDEAAPCVLGVAAPQAMQSAIAAGHHGVPFSLKKVIRKKICVVWSTVDEGAPRQTCDKTSNDLFIAPGLFHICEKRIWPESCFLFSRK